jgi:hypothetical protein
LAGGSFQSYPSRCDRGKPVDPAGNFQVNGLVLGIIGINRDIFL